MTDVLVYRPDYRKSTAKGDALRWHSNHRVFGDLLPGDRLWVITPGKSLGRPDSSAGYLVGMWPVAAVIENPGDDPDYAAPKYQHRVLISETEAIHRGLAAMIEANVAVDVQGAGQFRRGLQPVSGQEPGPFFRAVIETQGGQLAPQTTDFGNAVQPQQLAQLTGGLVLQLLDSLDAAQRHGAHRTITCSVL